MIQGAETSKPWSRIASPASDMDTMSATAATPQVTVTDLQPKWTPTSMGGTTR